MYIWDFSRALGAGRATTWKTRGLTRSTIRLMVPPLPAVSRPSNTMQIFAPVAFDPFLKGHQLGLQRGQLGFVLSAFQLLGGRGSGLPAFVLAHGFCPPSMLVQS